MHSRAATALTDDDDNDDDNDDDYDDDYDDGGGGGGNALGSLSIFLGSRFSRRLCSIKRRRVLLYLHAACYRGCLGLTWCRCSLELCSMRHLRSSQGVAQEGPPCGSFSSTAANQVCLLPSKSPSRPSVHPSSVCLPTCPLPTSLQLRHEAYFCFPDWTGGLYVTPTIAGSRAGGLTAACWASMVGFLSARGGKQGACRVVL